MDTSTLNPKSGPTPALSGGTEDFTPGSPVIYALHGKCSIAGIETREMQGKPIRFYKLEIQKSALSRSTRQEPAIWVPIDTARERGLRSPIRNEDADTILKILISREYYFDASLPWASVQPKLETSIRLEGAVGLAKVMSYLYVLKRKQVVPGSDVTKLYETVTKLLLRELSEATGEPIRDIESKVAKAMRHKLMPDN